CCAGASRMPGQWLKTERQVRGCLSPVLMGSRGLPIRSSSAYAPFSVTDPGSSGAARTVRAKPEQHLPRPPFKNSNRPGLRLRQGDLREKVLDPIRPGFAFRRVLFTPLLQRSLELAKNLLLVIRQANRRFHRDMAVQVTGVAGPQTPYPLAPQAESLAGLRPFRNRDLAPPRQGRHFELPAQSGRRKRNGQFAVQVFAIALEYAMRFKMDLDVQVARRAAIDTRLTVAAGPYPHPVVDSGRNLDL